MKRYEIYRIVVMLLACSAGSALGQSAREAAPQTGSYVVTMNFNSAVLATAEARKQLGDLQAKLAPRETQLQKLSDSIEAEKKQLGTDAAPLSGDARRTRIEELNRKSQDLQRQAEDFQNDSRAAAEQIYQHVAQRLIALLGEYSRQHGYSLVVERGMNSAPIVWYAAGNFDITEQLVKSYDLKFGVSNLQTPGTSAPDAPGARPASTR